METTRQAPGRGLFITFEGPEGSGKTTQIRLLGEYLSSQGREVLLTREPGGTPLAEQLRGVLKNHRGEEKLQPGTELLLMEAARHQHVMNVIAPALAAGKIVLCDRFFDSTTAYQGGARGIEGKVIDTLNGFAVGGCRPQLTFLLDLPPEVGFRRAGKRPETLGEYDRFEEEDLAFHRRVRESFLEIARLQPERVRLIDADRGVDEIQLEIRRIVHEYLVA